MAFTIMLAAGGLVILFLLSFFQPALLLAILVFATLLQEMLFASIANLTTLNQVGGVILLGVNLVRAIVERRVGVIFQREAAYLFILLFMMVISFNLLSVGYEAPLQDIDQFIRGFAYLIMCLLIIRTEKDILCIAVAYVLGSLFIACTGFFWQAIFTPIGYFAAGRTGIAGITGHYIEYAIRCMIPLPGLIFFWIYRKNLELWQHGLFLAASAILSFAIVLSGSRGAVLSYFIMIALLFLQTEHSALRKGAFALGAFFLPFILPSQELIDQIVQMIRGQVPWDYSLNLRMNFLLQIFNELDLQMLFYGRGLENFRDFYSGINNPPHSMWGQTFFELGMLGLIVQIALVWMVVKKFLILKKNMAEHERENSSYLIVMGFAMSLFILLIWGFYENVGFLNGSKHLFIILGVFLAGTKVIDRRGYGKAV